MAGPAAPRPAPGETPLLALPVVVLDTETTGLDVKTDRIVQIGALRMTGETPHPDRSFERLVNPGMKMPAVARRIHGLGDAEVAGAPDIGAVLPELAAFLGGAVVVGHSIGFDLTILDAEAARAGVAWTPPRALDIGLLAAALDSARVEVSLETLADWLEVEISGRHTALGDALATARIYAKLLPRLRAAGVRTLAEAEAFQRRPRDMRHRQEQAGWRLPRDEATPFAPRVAVVGAPAIDGYLYRHRLADTMGAPPIGIAAEADLLAAARRMREHRIGALMVEPLTHGGAGIITERDMLLAFAERGGAAATARVAEVMSSPVVTLPADTFLYRALGRMARERLRHIGVTDADGAICGVFSLRTLLTERAFDTLALGDRIEAATNAVELARAQSELPRLAAALLDEGMAAREIAAIISAEGRAMTARAAEIAEQRMIEAGLGPAPAPYCVLVLGSGGRGESLLAPDQDNAVIVDDAYGGDLDSPEDWFTQWAERANTILDRAGVPYCKGGVMMRERPWRRSLAEWTAQLDAWTRVVKPEHLLNIDIFFDFTPVRGDESLASELRRRALSAIGARPLLLALGEQAGAHGPPLGLFGRFRRDDRGRVDLKAGGLLPIVSGARVMALRHGLEARATPERLLGAAKAAGGVGEADARSLVAAHALLLRLVLEQQVLDIAAGAPPSSRVELDRLSAADRRRLKRALEAVEPMREMVRAALSAAR